MQRDRQQRLSVNQAHDLGCVSKKDHSSNEEIQNHMNLIFVHVPKCGGTTIIDTLSNLSKRPLHIWPPENLFSIDDKQLFDADFIACHATLPAFKKRFGNKIENFKLITNLRNPV